MPTYYRVDMRRLRFGELWRIAPGLPFLAGCFFKLTGIPHRVDTAVTLVDRIVRLEPGSLDADIAELLEERGRAWEALGFQRQFDYTVPMKGSGQRGAARAFLAQDGGAVAQLLFVEKATPQLTRRMCVSNVTARLGDGRFLSVGSTRKLMDSPPEFESFPLPGHGPASLWRFFQEKLREPGRAQPVRIAPESLEAFIVDLNNRSILFHLQRGVYVPEESAP